MATLAPDIAETEWPRPAPGGATLGGATLDDLVAGAWRALTDARAAACPVCAAELTPRYGAGARAVGGGCGACGAELT